MNRHGRHHTSSLTARRTALEVERLQAEVERLHAEVSELKLYRELAFVDHLTGLRNRRYFEQRLSEELSLGSRTGTACSLVILDIDDFKRINDQFGHPAGDRVLRAVARLLMDTKRTMDVPCRIGGDELAVILPATDADGARAAARRLEAAARTVLGPDHLGPGLEVTLSLGTATFPDDGRTLEELFRVGDRAMYGSKRRRRSPSVGSAPSVADHHAA